MKFNKKLTENQGCLEGNIFAQNCHLDYNKITLIILVITKQKLIVRTSEKISLFV